MVKPFWLAASLLLRVRLMFVSFSAHHNTAYAPAVLWHLQGKDGQRTALGWDPGQQTSCCSLSTGDASASQLPLDVSGGLADCFSLRLLHVLLLVVTL